MTINKEAIISVAWLGLGEDGILRVRIVEGAHIDRDMARLHYETMMRLTEGKTVPVLIDARADFSFDKEAYDFGSKHTAHRVATAVLVRNVWSKAMTNAYLTFFKPVSPHKLFTNEADAIAWLKEQEQKISG